MRAPEGVVAVVLGGGGPGDRLAAATGAPSKALVPFGGRPLATYVLEALRDSGVVSHVVFVGDDDERLARAADRTVPPGVRMVDSLALGLGAGLAASDGEPLLVVGADVPWWTSDGVRAFVADAPDADLVYPVVRAEDAERAFPSQRRTYVRCADGRFTGGNAVLVRPTAVPLLLPWIDRAYAARKRPWQLAGIVGARTLAGLATGRIRLAEVEARVRALTGIDARVHVTDDAAIAADVDRPEHLEGVRGAPARLADGGPA